MSRLPSDGNELAHHSRNSPRSRMIEVSSRGMCEREVSSITIKKSARRNRSWKTHMTHDVFRSERCSIPRHLGCGPVYLLIALAGCSRPPNEALSPLPPSVTAHVSAVAPAPKPEPKRYPPPLLVDQSIGVVVDDKSVSTLCRRAMEEQIRYECRIPEQPVPENVGFPAKADQVIICLGRVNDQGKYVSVSTARSKLLRTPRGHLSSGCAIKNPSQAYEPSTRNHRMDTSGEGIASQDWSLSRL